MILWFILASMTAAAIFAVLWPLGRGPRARRGGSDLLVYKDQLREIDRDRAAGLIGDAEAEAARLEISRRLLAAAEAQPKGAGKAAVAASPQSLRRKRLAAILVLVILPLGPPSLYLALGSPDVPDQSAFARVNAPSGREPVAALVGQVEALLGRNPNDGRGWELIAPVYMRLGRFGDAVEARRKALELNGETAVRHADLGEALAAAADGIVTVEAKAQFERAVAIDAHEPKARYFLGLAASQDGNSKKAAAIWRSLLDGAPPGAPWVGFVRKALARLSASSPIATTPTAGESAKAGADGLAAATAKPGAATATNPRVSASTASAHPPDTPRTSVSTTPSTGSTSKAGAIIPRNPQQ